MCPGFDSRTRRYMWVEFVVGSHPSSEGFSPGSPVFLPPQKSTFLNFNSIGNSRATGLSVKDCYVLPSLNKVNLLLLFFFYVFIAALNQLPHQRPYSSVKNFCSEFHFHKQPKPSLFISSETRLKPDALLLIPNKKNIFSHGKLSDIALLEKYSKDNICIVFYEFTVEQLHL